MKKSLIALAALATVATAAQAQSSVTIYGILDAGATYASKANATGQSQTLATDGILNTSRFGFKGTEDLGGGLKANFVLESGFNPTTGASSRSVSLFDRRAVVGLSGSWGAIDLGRNTNVGYDYAAEGVTDPLTLAYDGYKNLIANTAAFGNSQKLNTVITVVANTTLGTTRNDSTIKYTYNGSNFQVAGAYKPGGVAGGGAENSAYSVGGKVTVDVVTAAYSHFEATDASNRKLKYDSLGATANVTGQLKLTAGYHELKADAGYGPNNGAAYAANTTSAPNLTTETFAAAPGTSASVSGKLKVTAVGAAYAVTPALTTTLAYNEAKVSGAYNGKLENYVLQNIYGLSKRTSVYGTLAYSKVDADAVKFAGQNNATVFIVGVNHKF